MTFRLQIEIGNAAVQTSEDITELLRTLAIQLTSLRRMKLEPRDGRRIMDLNGNMVGNWEVTNE